jgi:hypothetical protein
MNVDVREIASFMEAFFRIAFAVIGRGHVLEAKEIEAVLVEDGRTVLLTCCIPGETLHASFQLSDETTEAEFYA